MPNWCTNWIEISGDKESIQKIKEKMESIENSQDGNLFMTLVGIPDEVTDYDTNWYDTNVNSWGTKWDVSLDESNVEINEDHITMSPITAWSPPIKFCVSLATKYGVDIVIIYEEPGCDFCGKTIIKKDGTYVEEDYSFLEGKYILDNETFWYEVDSNLEYFVDEENPSFEDFIKSYDFVSDEDKEEIKRMYDESLVKK
jgi:hypothetical protein